MKLLNNLYCIDAIDQSEEGILCSIRLIEDSPIYKAHFPTQPITPGACVVQMAVEMYEEFKGSRVQEVQEVQGIEIVKVKNAKFLKAMIPGGGRVFRFAIRESAAEQGLIHLQVVVTSDDVTYAKLSLICKAI